jgi:hypothetical protein
VSFFFLKNPRGYLSRCNLLKPFLLDWATVLKKALIYVYIFLTFQVTMPKSEGSETVRSDFVVNESVVVEVKSCVCADYQKDTAPEFSKKDRYVTVISEANTDQYKRTGLFPIGKRAQKFEGQKVVSERCIKHLRHLAKIARGEEK